MTALTSDPVKSPVNGSSASGSVVLLADGGGPRQGGAAGLVLSSRRRSRAMVRVAAGVLLGVVLVLVLGVDASLAAGKVAAAVLLLLTQVALGATALLLPALEADLRWERRDRHLCAARRRPRRGQPAGAPPVVPDQVRGGSAAGACGSAAPGLSQPSSAGDPTDPGQAMQPHQDLPARLPSPPAIEREDREP